MNIYSKTKRVLRKTEWVVLNTRKYNEEGWLDTLIDKNFYQKVVDPGKLVKISAIELWSRASLWFFIFFMISIIMLLILSSFYKYISDSGQEIGTLFRLNAPIVIYVLAMVFTYFLFVFRMPSATSQSLVSEDSVNKVVLVLRNEIISEKEADLVEKNISDLAEFFKRRKILIRIVTMVIITFLFKEAEGSSVWISTGITTFIALLFEMYALGSGAIFVNAKYAVREIGLEYNNTKNDENSNIS